MIPRNNLCPLLYPPHELETRVVAMKGPCTADQVAESWPGFPPIVHSVIAHVMNGMSPAEAAELAKRDCAELESTGSESLKWVESHLSSMDIDGNIIMPNGDKTTNFSSIEEVSEDVENHGQATGDADGEGSGETR